MGDDKGFFPNDDDDTRPSADCFFAYVTSKIQQHNDKVNETFKYFLTVATLLFVGLGWYINSYPKIDLIPEVLIAGMYLIAFLTSALIFINARAKHGYRNLEVKLTGRVTHKPTRCAFHSSEIVMWLSILIVSVVYIYLVGKVG